MNKNEIKQKAIRFLQGRYGTDDLNKMLFVVTIILIAIKTFFKVPYVILVADVLLVIQIMRSFSKNYVKRRIENDHYKRIERYITRFFKVVYKNVKDRNYHYTLCPKCVQMVRIPRKKGKVTITCPHCKSKFDAKS